MSPRATRPARKSAAAKATGGLLAASPAGIVGWAWLTAQGHTVVPLRQPGKRPA